MIRAHKIRLNPTSEQEVYLKKACGTSRFAYNWALANWKAAKEAGLTEHGPMALKKEFNAIKRIEFPWVLDVTKNAAEDGFRRLGQALNNYFTSKKGGRKGKNVGFPHFKSKKRAKQSFTLDYERFKVEDHLFSIQKLATPINMAEALRFTGKLLWATVSYTAGHWYVSIQVELPDVAPASCPCAATGVDVGIKTLAVLSSGEQFENQKLLRSELAHYKRLSRRLSRRKPGSHRWYVSKQQLARFHERIANQRLDIIHKMTTKITREYELVVVEDLSVAGMLRNHRLALSLADASLGEILRQLGYKAHRLVKVGRFFASSKTCSDCGYVNQTLMLADRKWTCSSCGTIHDRDFNAAVNILQEGLRLVSV
jgi:putative transposase